MLATLGVACIYFKRLTKPWGCRIQLRATPTCSASNQGLHIDLFLLNVIQAVFRFHTLIFSALALALRSVTYRIPSLRCSPNQPWPCLTNITRCVHVQLKACIASLLHPSAILHLLNPGGKGKSNPICIGIHSFCVLVTIFAHSFWRSESAVPAAAWSTTTGCMRSTLAWYRHTHGAAGDMGKVEISHLADASSFEETPL